MSFFRRLSEKRKAQSDSASSKGKSSAPQTPTGAQHPNISSHNGTPGIQEVQAELANPALLLLQDQFTPGDLGMSLGPSEDYSKKSKLCRSLDDIIRDHEAVPYLIQYLDTCKAAALLRFWLDAESFQASTWTRIRTHSLRSVSKSSVVRDMKASSESLNKSINKDITSPMSVSSIDSGAQDNQSVSSENLSATVTVSAQSCKHSNDTEENKSSEHLSDSFEDKIYSRRENFSDSSQNQSVSSSSDVTEKIQNSGDKDSSVSESCDSRNREKCKNNTDRQSMTLPLCSVNCDTLEESASARTESASTGTECAISYRDLTTPSPTDPSKVEPETGTKLRSSSQSLTSSTNSLADKLKRSVEQDAVQIFTKYLAQEATHPIGVSDELRNHTIRKICREDGQVDPECFVECQQFAVSKIREQYFEGFQSSVFHCKYQVEVLTSGKLHITDVIYNETALFYFMEYLEQEELNHLLQFVIAADNFEDMLTSEQSYNGLQAQDDAMVLYDKYFSLQAAVPLGFPDEVRIDLEGNICREEGPLPECFSKPRHIILHILEKRHFQQYLTSDVYYKYLSELVSAVQTAQDFPLGQRRRRRGSETSSEHSIGSQSVGAQSVGSESISSKNTLLASGTTRPVQLSKLEENMKNLTIDDGLLNPDKLWERPQSGRMTLGKIDSLGQFVSQFVPDPESSSSGKKTSGGSRFFKSKKDKEKEQEEMARKVAEMILNDVTSVTQAVGAIKNPTASNNTRISSSNVASSSTKTTMSSNNAEKS